MAIADESDSRFVEEHKNKGQTVIVDLIELRKQAETVVAQSGPPTIDVLQKVGKQHYVPRRFLLNWASPGSQRIAFRYKNEDPEVVGVNDVAWKKYYYAYPDLSPSDVKLLIQQVEQAKDIDREFLSSHYYVAVSLVTQLKLLKGIKDDHTLQVMKMLLDTKDLEPQYRYMLCSAYNGFPDSDLKVELIHVLETVVNNGFEGWMTIHENQVNPLFEGIINKGDVSFWENSELACQFLHCLAIQLMRTPKYTCHVNDDKSQFVKEHPDLMHFTRFATAYLLGKKLVVGRSEYEVSILHNKSPLAFITGDQPLLNLCGASGAFVFYYPLSPTVAIFYAKKGRLHDTYQWLERLGPREVDWLNKRLANACVSQVYADSKETLLLGGYKAGMNT